MLLAALKYRKDYKFSVIPVGSDKKPLVKWEEYQKRIATDDEVRTWWEKTPNANIGIVTGRISDLAVIDIDTAEGQEAIGQFIPESLLMPCADTARGGKHLYFRMPDTDLRNNARLVPGCDLRAEGGYVVAPPSKTANGAYSWVEAAHISKTAIPPIPNSYLIYIKNNNINTLKYKESIESGIMLFSEGRRDEDLFHVAFLMAQAGGNEAEILQTLTAIASSWGEAHLVDWLKDKVKSAFQRVCKKEINVAEEVQRYIALSSGYFCVTDCYNALQELQSVTSVTNRDKLRVTVRQALHRLKESGILRSDLKRNGYYERIDDICEDIDITAVSTDPHPVALPVNLRDLVKLMPKNIVIIAGAKSSGKTAFLLTTAWLNRNHKSGVYYYNSEMAGEELRSRLDDFGEDYPLKEWQKVKFKERTGNFHDIIKQRPNAIHIIDFLEVYDEFWKVGGLIREIHDAIDKGIVIIAIQKNPTTKFQTVEFGLGGARSIEKARLYLTLDRGRMKITDCKMFTVRTCNPRGYVLNYKLANGCHYFPDEWGWHEEDEGEKHKF